METPYTNKQNDEFDLIEKCFFENNYKYNKYYFVTF